MELKLVSPLFDTLAHGESRRKEIAFELPVGRRTFELDTVPLRDNKNRLAGWLSMLHDVTERKEGERTLTAALDHERQLRVSLEEEISRRLRFSQALVHEVKTLVEPAGGGRSGRRTSRETEDLNLRLDELLDFTRGEMGLLETALRPMAPLPVIQDALAEPEELPAMRIDLPDSLPSIRADGTRFKQILRSLLDHAAARTRPGNVIEVTARQEGNEVVVQVRDSGPELTAEERAHLFDPYQRAAMERLLPGGLGLGLALSKMLVELHGGRLWAESAPGHGCTFTFTMPVAGEA